MKKTFKRLFLLVATLGFAFIIAGCTQEIPSTIPSFSFEEAKYELELGTSTTIMPLYKDGDITQLDLEWASSDESVVTYENGELKAVGVGEAIVRAYIKGKRYISASTTINVVINYEMPTAKFDIDGYAELNGVLYVGDVNKLVYELSHENPEAKMVFASSNEKVATVDEEGNITTHAKGDVKITAKVQNIYNEDKYLEYTFAFKVKELYTITYELNGGTAEGLIYEYRTEECPLELPIPVKPGYKFLGWYGNSRFTGPAMTELPEGSDHSYSLFAKWEKEEYTVEWDLQNGVVDVELPTNYNVDDVPYELPVAKRLGYTFLGWYEGEVEVKAFTIENLGNKELVAKWELNVYQIEWDLAGGELSYELPETYDINNPVDVYDYIPEKEMHHFKGYKDAEGNLVEELVVTEEFAKDIKLIAQWIEFTYEIVTEPDVNKTYYFSVYQNNLKKQLYMTGDLSGYYGKTTTDVKKAAKVKLVEVSGGYQIKLTKANGSVVYLCAQASGSYNNIKFYTRAPFTTWKWNTEYNTFTTVLGSNTVYAGTYNNFDTFSLSKISYAATSFVGHLYEEVELTDEYIANRTLKNIELEESISENYTLPTIENVTWSLKETYKNATLDNSTLKVSRPKMGEGDAEIVVIATATINDTVVSKEFEMTIIEEEPYEIVEVTEFETEKVYKFGFYQGNVKKQLYATGKMSGFYGATTEDFDAAVDVQLIETEGGYYIQVLNGTTPQYINVVKSGSYTNYKYENTAKSVWVYNATYNTFTTVASGTEYYVGSYKTFTTFSPSAVSYLGKAGNFASHLYEKVPLITEVEESMNIYANKGVLSNKRISWVGENFEFINEQHKSSSAIRTSDKDHFRMYASSKTTISGVDGATITKVVITCTSASYATALKGATFENDVTVTVSGSVVTIVVNGDAIDKLSIVMKSQSRLKKVEIYGLK